ncbi:MAG: hypothetical protein ACRD5J_09855 [Nitrososphaeraceae archaeon]
MMTKGYKKYSKLFNQYMNYDEEVHDKNASQAETDSYLENIRNEATKLLEKVIDDELRKRIAKLIEYCNNSSYSHMIYIENKQLIILETKDTGKKYVMIKVDRIGDSSYIDACEYDDVIKKEKEVLSNNYLVKIKVNLRTAIKAHELLDQVRRENGNSTLLYGRKEVYTSWVVE